MKKKLFDLMEKDIEENPVWYFPMQEDEDELMVQTSDQNMSENSLKIVATNFLSSSGKEYIGYVYVDVAAVNSLKPVIIYGEKNLNFWKGIRKPKADLFEAIELDFGNNFFPIKFKTLTNSINFLADGELNGIYFFDENKKICCLNS